MSTLPASVRLALWATASYAGRLPLTEAVRRALPDVDDVRGDVVERLALWRDLGERAVLVALPRPGDVSGMPGGSADLVAAATSAGECVYVPGVGGAMVPTLEVFGPEGDQGLQVTWTAYDADPVPVHRIEALSLAEVERQLRLELVERTAELDALDVKPWAGSDLRTVADDRLGDRRWGLPDGLPARAVSIIATAGAVDAIADVGLAHEGHVLAGGEAERRRALLARLQAAADTALASAASVGALHLAGLVPDRR